jgi:hypothetical protein
MRVPAAPIVVEIIRDSQPLRPDSCVGDKGERVWDEADIPRP